MEYGELNELTYKIRGINAACQVPLKVSYKESTVGDYVADILVEDQIILELKTVDEIQKIHEAQLINYLKATGLRIGLIVNFKHPKAEIKRLVYELQES
jgi:GxxExxY protein